MQISRTITLITMIAAVLRASSLASAASLDVPSNGDTLSGIGIIHGWKCEAEGAITIRFDAGDAIPATYGFPRGDTSQTCGGDDGNNGFYAFYNWAILGDGTHTAVAYDDGREFARSTFTVGTTGEEFLKGVTVSIDVPDFPAPGETGHFVWNESTQHLELTARPAEPVDCTNWTDYEAFKTATHDWVRACLAAGMDLEATNERGNTPLLHAAQYSPPDVVRLLLDQGADVTGARSGAQTWTALHSAALRRDAAAPAVMQMLLEAGADPNVQAGAETYRAGQTPLHPAARQLPLVELLLNAGANPNVRDANGETVLQYAANTLPVVRLLLARGANPHLADMGGRTPLFEAVYHENVAVVRALLNGGAQATARSHTGWTPLHEAVIQHNVELVRLLLDAGADPLAAANNGRTPIDVARRQDQPAIEQILLAASGQDTTPDPPSLEETCANADGGVDMCCVCQASPEEEFCTQNPHLLQRCPNTDPPVSTEPPGQADIHPFFGHWTLTSTMTGQCSASTGDGTLRVGRTGSVSGRFSPHNDTVQVRPGVYRRPARYDITGTVSPAGRVEATWSFQQHRGSLSGNLYETGTGTGTWRNSSGCAGRWQATR